MAHFPSDVTHESMQDTPVSRSDRTLWLTKLEIEDKVRSQLLDAISRGEQARALRCLNDGNYDGKIIRSRAYRNLPTGLTALHLAALFGDEAIVARLLEMNADLKVTCYCQITSHSVSTKFWMDARPLLFAIGAKNSGVVRRLTQHGAPVTMDDAWPLFSTEWWHITGRFEWTIARAILSLLMQERLNINQRAAKIRWSLLHYCINMEPRSSEGIQDFLQGRYETVAFLLNNGADALLKVIFGRTAYALLEDRLVVTSFNAQSELDQRKADADERLKDLLQMTMRQRLTEIKQANGLRGSLQRLTIQGQSLDRLPLLLRNGASSLRRFSLASSTNVSRLDDVASQA